jgi:ABC-2 type transport system ATP-binding protein
VRHVSPPAVEANAVGKRYGALVALEDLSFSAEQGEILGVLGPNGAGKTTAIRILTTILEPTHGTFSVAGIPHTRPAEIRRRTGVLPENPGYPERQTAEEFLRYQARLFGLSRAAARGAAASLLEEVGLAGRGRNLIATYSRGMQQRLGIARALVNEPQVVVLDEPTLGLDPAGQRQMGAIIRRIADDRGATVLLCTHLLAEVEETCSRVVILNRGRVVARGTVAEVAHRAGASRTACIRIAPEDSGRARAALSSLRVDSRGGALRVSLDGVPSNEPLHRLLEAGIDVHSYELEAARLSDAFLAMTESGV